MFVDEAASGLTHDYFNHVLESFKRTAEERGYDITFTSGRISGQKLSYYEHCRYRGVDGVVIACVDFYADEVQELIRSEIPVVRSTMYLTEILRLFPITVREWKNWLPIFITRDTDVLRIFMEIIRLLPECVFPVFIGLYSGWEWRYQMITLKNVRTEMQIALQGLRGNCGSSQSSNLYSLSG